MSGYTFRGSNTGIVSFVSLFKDAAAGNKLEADVGDIVPL